MPAAKAEADAQCREGSFVCGDDPTCVPQMLQCDGIVHCPNAFDEALEMNIIGDGSTVLFLGLGSGLTWGAVIVRVGS